MTSAAPTRPPAGPAPMRPGGPGQAPGGGPAIDPIKLLKKWKWVAVAAAVVGAMLGFVVNVVWGATYPFFQSTVVYEALPPQEETLLESTQVDETALEQFMATQAAYMTSRRVLERVASDPRVQTEAPNWSAQFQQAGGFDSQTATMKLEDIAKAGPIGGTSNIRLTVTWRDKNDVAVLARLLSEAYLADLRDLRGRDSRERRDAIQRAIDDIRQEIENLTERRARLIRDEDVSSINEQSALARGELTLITRSRSELLLMMRRMQTQLDRMEQMVNSESGVRYSDTQRAMADQRPIVQGMKNEREALEIRLNELRRSGFLPSHREYKRVERNIAALEQQISVTIERELAGIFDAEKDMLESEMRAMRAQEADLIAREEILEQELEDLTRTIREINDLTNEIGALNQTLADRRSSLADLETTTSLASAGRIVIRESPRVPDERTMPKLVMMVPLGMILMVGLVGGTIVAVEFLDQRVKSTADLASMPRTKILGSVPMAGEDPTASSTFETIFRDSDTSVIAESFRQIRTGAQGDGRGGAQDLPVPLGHAGLGQHLDGHEPGVRVRGRRPPRAADRRELPASLDAQAPGRGRQPGLGDVLAGAAELEDAIRRSRSRRTCTC
jgi:uncharacterized protein involved in exopolysaccharide biosynthesis